MDTFPYYGRNVDCMGHHPRIESSKLASFVTTRSRNSELWFANNPKLEKLTLAYAAKYSQRYDVKLYGLAMEGSHVHSPAHFPLCNRASFMRDFNSCVAKAVKQVTPNYPGGKFWGERYSSEFLPNAADLEDKFFYTVLQPVYDRLVEKLGDYPFYNCFSDAVRGNERNFKLVRWGEYNSAKRYNSKIRIKDYTDTFILKFERLPGYEHLSQKDYSKLMHEKLEERRLKIVQEYKAQGLTFMGPEKLKEVVCGSRAKNPKTSNRIHHRPRVLSKCAKTKRKVLDWYFKTLEQFKQASNCYRQGDFSVEFPPGTYRPPFLTCGIPPPGYQSAI